MTEASPLPPFWEGGPPEVDSDHVRPTVDEVALLERTRTADSFGNELPTFTSETRPSDNEVDGLISHAVDEVLGQLPSHIDPIWYPAISRVIALRAATVIETSYFREQSATTAATWTARFADDLAALRGLIPGATPVA